MVWRDSQVCSGFHPPSLLLMKSMASINLCQGHSQGGTDLVLTLPHVPVLPHSRQLIRTAGYPNNQKLAYKYLLYESDLIDFWFELCEVISWFAVGLTWASEGNTRLLEPCWAHHLHKPTKNPWEICFSISITSIVLVIKEMLST